MCATFQLYRRRRRRRRSAGRTPLRQKESLQSLDEPLGNVPCAVEHIVLPFRWPFYQDVFNAILMAHVPILCASRKPLQRYATRTVLYIHLAEVQRVQLVAFRPA